MKSRRVSWIAWGLFGMICIVTALQIIYKYIILGFEGSPVKLVGELLVDLSPFVFGFLAVLIITNQSRNIIGWLFMIPAYFIIVAGPAEIYLRTFGTKAPPANLLNLLMAWVTGWGWIMLIFPILFILLLFPTGRLPSPRWRWIIPFGVVWCGLFIFIGTFTATLGPFQNPIGFLSETFTETLMTPWVLGLGIFTLLCFVSLFVRYRRANAAEREQIKWVFYSGGIFAFFYALNLPVAGDPSDLAVLLLFLFLLAIPTTITIAILRYRLWDIDVIIRRTLLYAALTALLGLVYFGIVVVLQDLFGRATGEENSPLAIVISTLVIAALFNPLRARLQEFIDRRFFRQKYDADQALDAFAHTARDEVEIERLTVELVSTVQKSMHPQNVTLWMKK